MGFAVLFGLLIVVSCVWLHSRWMTWRTMQAQRRDAEMMLVFEAGPKAAGSVLKWPAEASRAPAREFVQTMPGDR